MNDIKAIKTANRLRLETVADTLADAVKKALEVGDEAAYDRLRNAMQLYNEFKQLDPVL